MTKRPPQPRPPKPPAAPAPLPAPPPAGGFPLLLHRVHQQRGLIIPLAFIGMLGVLIVPLPPVVMDLLIIANFTVAILVLLTTISMEKPLDFSVFPSLLLATTLFRLVLNVASTRLILSADASSPEEAMGVAGHVVQAFANFVAGDSLYVGIVIFLILVIVQFVVITKGATRISEVAARFTLDAMPGKQMAIDADLAAGVIDEGEARQRRDDIAREADFFGAMDGASKFVRGDAIAGIIITVVNVLGGFAVGMLVKGWPAGQTAEVFTKLTIGDGLTSQLPAFIVSIAAALIVTRSGSKAELGQEVSDQLMRQPSGLGVSAVFMAAMALTPLPTIPLLLAAGGLGFAAWAMSKKGRRVKATQAAPPPKVAAEPPPVENLLKVDTLELEVGYALVPLIDAGQGGDVLDRITKVRRELAVELGLVMPPVRIRDNMVLPPAAYRVKIRNNPVAQGELRPGRLLAMDAGLASGALDGEPTKEPAFGLDARWIDPALRTRAETMNYTVVEPSAVLATHLTEVVRKHADELLTREEVNNLLEQLKQKSPKLVDDVVPGVLKPGELQRVLQALLRERVPVRDLESILETLAEWGSKTKDPDVLVEYVRNALRRTICNLHAQPRPGARADAPPRLLCVTLDPTLEDQISAFIDRSAQGTVFTMPARLSDRVARQVLRALQSVVAAGAPPVVIASPQVRAVVRQMLAPHLPNVAVLGYNEVVSGVEVESLALVMPPPPEQSAGSVSGGASGGASAAAPFTAAA